MSELVNLSTNMPSAYLEMMSKTAEVMPKITESTKAFYKSDSQVKNVSLNITELTDVGSASHILARIEQKKQALQESEIKVRKKQVKLARKKAELETVSGFDADNLELDILEIQTQIETIQNYQSGAIREVRFLVEQYEAICMRLGVEIITEEMLEADQPLAQTARAFSQALAAARARGGIIDEGNFIFFQDLGINGAAAQREVTAYFEMEQEILNQGNVPTFELQYEWVRGVASKFAGEVTRYAEHRGLVPLVQDALHPSLESTK
jgi:hypothetical protein